MLRLWFLISVFFVIISGCAEIYSNSNAQIVKIIDFELSPEEERIAFSALTPTGNTDIWVVNIDGKALKRLTFKSFSPSNRIAKFFKKYNWRNFFTIDMHSPEWTRDGRIVFYEEVIKHDIGVRTVGFIHWTISPKGEDKRPKTEKDETIQRKPFWPLNIYQRSRYSEKYKKTIFRENGALWILNDGESIPRKLI